MEMKSMKMAKEEPKEHEMMEAKNEEAPKYPYGLCLHLDSESIKMLGLDKVPEIGSEHLLHAKVKVTSVSESESIYGENKSVSLQITDMALESKG